MASNIKGITINIDGNTQGLDKALKNVDSKTRALNGELRQINNLLKFDPKNATLLDQKMQVLADKVNTAKERLKELENAQAQVKAQYERGEIDDGQYRAFQREIEKTKQDLDKYENELNECKTDVDKLGDETQETATQTNKLGDDAQKNAGKVGGAFNTTAINMSSITNIVRNIGSAISQVIQGAINLGKKMAEIVNDYLQNADDINTASEKYGISPETYQQWQYASELIDVSAETMGASLGKLTRALRQYQNGNADTVKAFDDLGVAVYDSSGKFRKSEDIFYDTIDALGKLDDETQANIYANQLYGRSYQELEPLIYAGSDAVKELGQEAENLGIIMPQEQLDNMNEAKDALDKLKSQLGVALAPVISALAPHIESIAKWISEKLASPKVQELLTQIGEALGQIFEGVAKTLEELANTGQLEELIDAVIDFIPVLADFITNSLPALVEFLQQALGLIQGLATPTQEFDDKLKNLKTDSKAFTSEAQLGVGMLKKAYTQNYGDMGKTISDMLDTAGIDHAEFYRMAEGEGGLKGFVAKWTLGMHDAGESIKTTFSNAWTNISNWFASVGQWFSELPNKIGSWFASIPEKIASIFTSAKNKISEWFNSIGQWFRELPNKIWEWIKSIPQKIAKAFSGKATVSANGQIGYHGSYAEGGIFKKSSFINVGEDGPEVVMPVEKMSGIIANALRQNGGNTYGGTVNVQTVVNVSRQMTDGDIDRLGSKITKVVSQKMAVATGGKL